MKKIISLIFAITVISFCRAQEADDQQAVTNAAAREKIKAARIGFITQQLGLTPEQAEKFWPLYNEMMQKRVEMRNEYKAAEKNVNPNNPDPKQQQALVDLGLKLKQDQINLEKEYSDKLKNVITAQQLLNLHRAEKDFRATIIQLLNNRRLQQQRTENFRERNMRLRQRKNN
ncbi:MAG: hypothetical protein JST43_01760 [Bacteroidetes bacterium]|nr:hypothetical protein [Bacteroidota bacterium]MBS1541947.1 hypothetical protein [Bacteroidota bacterium]